MITSMAIEVSLYWLRLRDWTLDSLRRNVETVLIAYWFLIVININLIDWLQIHLAFCLTPDLLEYANLQSFFSCGRMPEGNEFNESDSERKMKFQRELDIEFVHHAIQVPCMGACT